MKCIDKLLIALACVLSLATSTSSQILVVPGIYQVNSDCPSSERSGQLEISDTLRGEMSDGTKFGFPTNQIEYRSDGVSTAFPRDLVTSEVGSNVKVYVTNETRRCRGLTWDKTEGSMLFICEENGEVVCTIYLDRVGKNTSSSQSTEAVN